MSSTVKAAESKKPKNSTYQNSANNMNFKSSKNSKLVFTTISKNKKIPYQTNSAKKRYTKNQYFPQHEINNTDNLKDSLIFEKKGLQKQDKKNNNENEMKENQNINDKRNLFNEEDIQSIKVLKSVDSFTSIGFLLPNNSNNIDKTDRKTSNKKRNKRYGIQEDYDYDGNILYCNPHFGMESSGKKRKITPAHNAKNVNINIDSDSSNEEEIDKLKKQEELIIKLMKYKNFRNFIKKILKHKKYEIDTKGKLIGWSTFKINLYKIAFLDLYYRHRLPFIIMRPRLDVIKRKREERQRQMKEKTKMEEKTKENGGNLHNGSIEIKEGETTYASVLDKNIQNEMEKNGYIIGEDYKTVRIEKRESLFPTKDGKQRSIFTLTKIPQKTGDENNGNIRLKMAFIKAKDAARVVRRLQYSYSMRVNILLSKPIFQKNAKIIQNWYRSIKLIKINTPKIVKIQAFVRGMMIRKAFKEVRNFYERILPFIYEIDKIISRKFAILLFDKLIPRYGLHAIIKLAKIKNNKIINALSKYVEKKKLKKETYSLSTKIKNKCCYTKETFEYPTRIKLLKLQSYIKSFLMLHNEKIMLKYANEYNPKLYYYMKYGKNKDLLKKKLKFYPNLIVGILLNIMIHIKIIIIFIY